MQNFVLFDHVCKTYRMGDVCIDALKDASFTIAEGEICVVVGQSGAGKTVFELAQFCSCAFAGRAREPGLAAPAAAGNTIRPREPKHLP